MQVRANKEEPTMSPTPIFSNPAKRYTVAHLRAGDAALPGRAPALSVIDNLPCTHRSLPSDLFALIAFCDERVACSPNGEAGRSGVRIAVTALRTRPVTVSTAGIGQTAIAMLTPAGLMRAFACPLNDLTDQRIELRDLVSLREEAALHATLLDAAPGAARSAALGRWLEQRTASHRCVGARGERVEAVAMSMVRGPHEDIDQLARQQRVSRRQLERDFRHWLGVPPRAYSRLVRFQRAAAAVASGMPLAHVAAEHGYADQAHMTRTFRTTAGVTPLEMGKGRDNFALNAALAGRVIFLPTAMETVAKAAPSWVAPFNTRGIAKEPLEALAA
jgi:AraC-like DNA-binding protein